MKPFDLEAALAGHPVITRDGRKAYVRHYEQELEGLFPLVGYVTGRFATPELTAWTLGGDTLTTIECDEDIVGMWEEPVTFDHWHLIDPWVTELHHVRQGHWKAKGGNMEADIFHDWLVGFFPDCPPRTVIKRSDV